LDANTERRVRLMSEPGFEVPEGTPAEDKDAQLSAARDDDRLERSLEDDERWIDWDD
jgi:hypothetical protein